MSLVLVLLFLFPFNLKFDLSSFRKDFRITIVRITILLLSNINAIFVMDEVNMVSYD